MSQNNTKWAGNGSTHPVIEPHTKTKHLLTEQYISDLIHKMYGQTFPHGTKTFTFVDGFCGGGIYQDPETKNIWHGSPIRLIRAVRDGYLKSQRTHTLSVKYIFIDNNKNHLECLKKFVMPNTGFEKLANGEINIFKSDFGELTEECEFICDDFEKVVNYCVLKADERKGHSLFFLDPFGWSDVSMESFRKINSLKKSEIIYTFMTDYIKRFVCSKEEVGRDTFERLLETEGYFDPRELINLDKFGEQAFYRNELMRLFRDRGNAKKIITFAVIPKNNDRVLYYLLHISSHLTALEVMKDGSWLYNNLDYQYHYDVYGQGFKTSTYFQENQVHLEFNINKDDQSACIERLAYDLDILISKYPQGISFKELRNKTMERNPATKKHYHQYLQILKDAKQIEITRGGKTYNGTDYQNKDIIKKASQMLLFDMRKL
jgi:three-Cys-motif partner protein